MQLYGTLAVTIWNELQYQFRLKVLGSVNLNFLFVRYKFKLQISFCSCLPFHLNFFFDRNTNSYKTKNPQNSNNFPNNRIWQHNQNRTKIKMIYANHLFVSVCSDIFSIPFFFCLQEL